MRLRVLLVVAIGLAFGLGYWMGARREIPRSPRAPVAGHVDPTQAGQRHETAAPRDVEGDVLRAALEAIPPEVPARGDGRIEGLVRDPDGAPLPDVIVSAYEAMEGPLEALNDVANAGDDLPEAVRRFVRWWRCAPVAETITGEDGRFVLEALAEADYAISAVRRGYDIAARDAFYIPTTRPGAVLDLVATPLYPVRVDVVLQDGSRPQSATVQVFGESASRNTDWTPDDDTVELPAGAFTFTAYVDSGGSTLESAGVRVTVARDPSPQTVTLTARVGVHGSITVGPREVMRGTSVHALAWSGPDAPSERQLLEQGAVDRYCRGAYHFPDLPSGRYSIGLATCTGVLLATNTVEVAGEPVRCDFDLAEVDSSRFLRLVVCGPDGRPCNDVDVTAGVRTGAREATWGNAGFRLDDGVFLAVYPPDTSPGTGVFFDVVSKKFGKRRVEAVRGSDSRVELRYAAAASVIIEITGRAPPARLWTGLAVPERRGVVASCHEKPADGRFQLGSVQPGDYQLLVFVGVGRSASVVAVRRSVTIAAGENRVSVELPHFHSLTVTDLVAGEPLMLEPGPERRWRTVFANADASGRVVFTALPGGRYVLRRQGGGTMAVDVDGAPVVVQFDGAR